MVMMIKPECMQVHCPVERETPWFSKLHQTDAYNVSSTWEVFFSNVYFQEKLSNVNASIIMYQKIFTGLQRPSQTPPVQLRGFVISRGFLVVALSIIVFFVWIFCRLFNHISSQYVLIINRGLDYHQLIKPPMTSVLQVA